jgi:hypothetical protein
MLMFASAYAHLRKFQSCVFLDSWLGEPVQSNVADTHLQWTFRQSLEPQVHIRGAVVTLVSLIIWRFLHSADIEAEQTTPRIGHPLLDDIPTFSWSHHDPSFLYSSIPRGLSSAFMAHSLPALFLGAPGGFRQM